MKKYLQNIAFPVLLEILCIIGFVLYPKKIVYINFIMLMGFILYYYKRFSFHELMDNVKTGLCFWKKVIYCFRCYFKLYYFLYIFRVVFFYYGWWNV